MGAGRWASTWWAAMRRARSDRGEVATVLFLIGLAATAIITGGGVANTAVITNIQETAADAAIANADALDARIDASPLATELPDAELARLYGRNDDTRRLANETIRTGRIALANESVGAIIDVSAPVVASLKAGKAVGFVAGEVANLSTGWTATTATNMFREDILEGRAPTPELIAYVETVARIGADTPGYESEAWIRVAQLRYAQRQRELAALAVPVETELALVPESAGADLLREQMARAVLGEYVSRQREGELADLAGDNPFAAFVDDRVQTLSADHSQVPDGQIIIDDDTAALLNDGKIDTAFALLKTGGITVPVAMKQAEDGRLLVEVTGAGLTVTSDENGNAVIVDDPGPSISGHTEADAGTIVDAGMGAAAAPVIDWEAIMRELVILGQRFNEWGRSGGK